MIILFLCGLVGAVLASSYPGVVCYRKWYFNRERPAPRRCPPADFFTYYECCGQVDDCCQRIRIEPILVVGIFLLLFICFGCCCICGFVFSKRNNNEKEESLGEESLSKDERECKRF